MKKFNINFKSLFFAGLSIFTMMMASSCIINGDVPLDTPKNLRVVNITHDSAVVLWGSVENANDYEVWVNNISTGEGGFVYFPDLPRVELHNLDWDETYEVKITALSSDTVWDKYSSSSTATITFKTKMPGVPDGELKRPSNLQSIYENGKVTLSWDKVIGADSYEISCEYFTSYNGYDVSYGSEKTVVVDASQNYFVDTKITDEISKVCYKVYARDNNKPEIQNWSKKHFIKIKK